MESNYFHWPVLSVRQLSWDMFPVYHPTVLLGCQVSSLMGLTSIVFSISYFPVRQLQSAALWDYCGNALKEGGSVKRSYVILDRVPHSDTLLHLFVLTYHCYDIFWVYSNAVQVAACLPTAFSEQSPTFARLVCNPSKCCWMKCSCCSSVGLWRDWDKERPTEGFWRICLL